MNPTKYLKGLDQKNRELSMKNSEFQELNEKRAKAEYAHSVALARKILELKAEGQAATLIPKLAAGDKVVAQLKMEMDVADGVCRACRESMRNLHGMIDSYRTTLSWLKAEMG
jgi:hypothetical protein